MNNIWTVIIIGLYTLVYVIVFVIQKAKMDKQDAIIKSMQSFMSIFDVDEVHKFVKLKEERLTMTFKKAMEDEERFKEITERIVNEKAYEIESYYEQEFGEKYKELLAFAIMVRDKQKEDSKKNFVEEFLPKNKNVIDKFKS